jgi:hypothetical protein
MAKTIADVVKRLTESRRRAENERYEDGVTAGTQWAFDDAEYHELQNASRLGVPVDRRSLFAALSLDSADDDVIGDALYRIIRPEYDQDPETVHEFWNEALQAGTMGLATINHSGYAIGFLSGISSVWAAASAMMP